MNQINKDRILIFNKVFQQQGNSQNQNKNPCKHLKYPYGIVTCQSMCQSFHITETMFDNFNQVFSRSECNGQFNFLRNPLLMAKLVNDSLEMSNKNENQKQQFSLQFQHVFVKLLQTRKVGT
ncbi:unnamed protein product [Paramecium pentaurelia]|uniref:Uncharacterized protein n=1 Tax=Paramecium pentaurelia TaxID=43138 RepID=A0A8S1Y7H9_9CILI|nr:unnamed protein product [Paramecium pentaurelia]